MKKMTVFAAVWLVVILSVMLAFPPNYAKADEVPDWVTAVESGEMEILLADAPPDAGSNSSNLGAIYEELRSLAKQYREAKDRNAKERVSARVQDLMGRLFDAKVQMERRRIQAAEEKLNKEKKRLEQLQSHKQDMVHKGTQKLLTEGELPEWAPKRNAEPNR
jgi:outer membrane murein-binding lipoprotein Lpp